MPLYLPETKNVASEGRSATVQREKYSQSLTKGTGFQNEEEDLKSERLKGLKGERSKDPPLLKN